MSKAKGKRFWGLVALSAGMLLATTASAWYGLPWYRPYGSGAMTYERQNMMRGHGYAMRDLASMFEGRRAFNRDEAVILARELEEGFGDRLVRNYAPGAMVAGSRTVPWTWNNFGLFQGYAEAARQASDSLGEALESPPSGKEVRQEGVWVTGPRMLHGRNRLLDDGLVSMEAIREYGRLNATCHSCHALFRGWRW
jgi:cytochrome c556